MFNDVEYCLQIMHNTQTHSNFNKYIGSENKEYAH